MVLKVSVTMAGAPSGPLHCDLCFAPGSDSHFIPCEHSLRCKLGRHTFCFPNAVADQAHYICVKCYSRGETSRRADQGLHSTAEDVWVSTLHVERIDSHQHASSSKQTSVPVPSSSAAAHHHHQVGVTSLEPLNNVPRSGASGADQSTMIPRPNSKDVAAIKQTIKNLPSGVEAPPISSHQPAMQDKGAAHGAGCSRPSGTAHMGRQMPPKPSQNSNGIRRPQQQQQIARQSKQPEGKPPSANGSTPNANPSASMAGTSGMSQQDMLMLKEKHKQAFRKEQAKNAQGEARPAGDAKPACGPSATGQRNRVHGVAQLLNTMKASTETKGRPTSSEANVASKAPEAQPEAASRDVQFWKGTVQLKWKNRDGEYEVHDATMSAMAAHPYESLGKLFRNSLPATVTMELAHKEGAPVAIQNAANRYQISACEDTCMRLYSNVPSWTASGKKVQECLGWLRTHDSWLFKTMVEANGYELWFALLFSNPPKPALICLNGSPEHVHGSAVWDKDATSFKSSLKHEVGITLQGSAPLQLDATQTGDPTAATQDAAQAPEGAAPLPAHALPSPSARLHAAAPEGLALPPAAPAAPKRRVTWSMSLDADPTSAHTSRNSSAYKKERDSERSENIREHLGKEVNPGEADEDAAGPSTDDTSDTDNQAGNSSQQPPGGQPLRKRSAAEAGASQGLPSKRPRVPPGPDPRYDVPTRAYKSLKAVAGHLASQFSGDLSAALGGVDGASTAGPSSQPHSQASPGHRDDSPRVASAGPSPVESQVAAWDDNNLNVLQAAISPPFVPVLRGLMRNLQRLDKFLSRRVKVGLYVNLSEADARGLAATGMVLMPGQQNQHKVQILLLPEGEPPRSLVLKSCLVHPVRFPEASVFPRACQKQEQLSAAAYEKECYRTGAMVIMTSQPFLLCPAQQLANLAVLLVRASRLHPAGSWAIRMRRRDVEHAFAYADGQQVAVLQDMLDAKVLLPLKKDEFSKSGPSNMPTAVRDAVKLSVNQKQKARFFIVSYAIDSAAGDASMPPSSAQQQMQSLAAAATQHRTIMHGTVGEVSTFLQHLLHDDLTARVEAQALQAGTAQRQ